ncbi:MAG: hypothetical protein K6B65_05895 [Bacilli bacterium]|nr:hypothetical protein [Bacilli bacterium]
MKKLLPRLLLLATLLSLASCSSNKTKKNCGSDGVCRIGDEKHNPNKLWEMPK